MTATLLSSSTLCGTSLQLPARIGRPSASRRPALVCAKKDDEPVQLQKLLSVPMAAALAGIMMTSAIQPDDALAARSSGRVGGSSFRSAAPRSAPRAAPSRGGGGGGSGAMRGGGGPSVRNYNTYIAPSPGYGYGGGGMSMFAPRPFFAPSPIFFLGGGFFNFIITMFVITTAFSVIRGVVSSKKDDRKDDEWD